MDLFNRVACAAIIAGATFSLSAGNPDVTHATASSMRIQNYRSGAGPLYPGSAIVVTLKADRPRAPYCLGLASLGDPFGLPLTLGTFQAVGRSYQSLVARIPTGILLAEPAGQFMLYAGECTRVAPLGNLASVTVTITGRPRRVSASG